MNGFFSLQIFILTIIVFVRYLKGWIRTASSVPLMRKMWITLWIVWISYWIT